MLFNPTPLYIDQFEKKRGVIYSLTSNTAICVQLQQAYLNEGVARLFPSICTVGAGGLNIPPSLSYCDLPPHFRLYTRYRINTSPTRTAIAHSDPTIIPASGTVKKEMGEMQRSVNMVNDIV